MSGLNENTFIDSGVIDTWNDSTRSSSKEQVRFFGDQWLHHKLDLSNKIHTDLLLRLGNGEEIHLHSAVLVPHSAMLTQLLGTNEGYAQTPTLYLPEVDKATVSLMVDLLYMGEGHCSLDNFSELNNLLNSLGLRQLLKSLDFLEADSQHGTDSNFCKAEPAEYTEQDIESDEIIFLKEVFSGAHEQLFPRYNINSKSLKSNRDREKRGPNLSTSQNLVVTKVEKIKNAKSKVFRKSKHTFDCTNCQSKFSSDNQLKVHKKLLCDKSNQTQLVAKTKLPTKKRKSDFNKIVEMKSLVGIAKKEKNRSDKFTTRIKSSLDIGSEVVQVKPQVSVRFGLNMPSHTGGWKYQKNYPKKLSSRQVVHGRNNINWAGETAESYEDVDVSWVKNKSDLDLEQFEDVTDREKSFFCSWNKFLIDHKPGVSRVHLKTVLEEFVDHWGKKVMKSNLYVEFVTHLVWLEQSGLISQQTLLSTVQRLQRVGS